MDIVIEQINSVGKTFVEFAWPMLWQASVLIVILLAADWLLRRKVRAVFRYWLWMLVLAKLFLPTTLSSPVSIGLLTGNTLPAINIAAIEQPVGGDISNVLPHSSRTAEIGEASAALHAEAPIRSQAVTPAVSLTLQGGIFLVWLMVVFAMLLLLMQRAVFVCGLVRQSAEATGLMKDALKFCCNQMGVRQTIGLKISPNATSPAVCGLFRPVILVPQGLGSSLGINSLRVVLMHELAHIKRGDLWVNLLQTVLQIAYFYNPLLWVANWVIRRVREQAVDEAVQVALGDRASQYLETLLNVARLAFERPALSLRLIGVVESKGALTSRIKRMLTRPIPKTAKLGIIGSLAILLLAVFLLPMAKAKDDGAVDNHSTVTVKESAGIDVGVEDFDIQQYPEGGLYTATVSIRNKGAEESPKLGVNFYRGDPNETKPMTHEAGPIEPGKVWNEGTMPFALKEGANEIAVLLDPDNTIGESDRTNNEASMKIVVKDGKIVEKKVFPATAAKRRAVAVGVGWQRLKDVIGDGYRGSISNYNGESFAKVLSWARPGDTFVTMFAFDEEKSGHSLMVPKEYEDLLPKPYREIKEQVERGEAVELKGEARGLDTIVLAAGTIKQLEELIESTELLQPFKSRVIETGLEGIQSYGVYQAVGKFPEQEDLSTPEAAYAAINRISASGDAAGWQRVSVKEIAENLAKESKNGKMNVESEWAKVLLNAKILEVRICNSNSAVVFAELPQEFTSEPIRKPIDIRHLKFEKGKWLNTGNDRVWTIEEAKAQFDSLCKDKKTDTGDKKAMNPPGWTIAAAEFGDTNGANARNDNRMSKPEKTGPPVVIKTTPEAFADGVSPDLKTITATFNQRMMDKSWSWTGGGETFPKTEGQPSYDQVGTTCRLPVSLEAGKVYWVGINSPSYQNFKNANGMPAKQYVILFATKGSNGKPTTIPEELIAKAKSVNEDAQKTSSEPEGKENRAESVPYTQITYDDIRPDGTIFFKNTIREINRSNGEITSKGFINSDFVHVTGMSDDEGRALEFKSTHDRNIYRYEVTFNKPIPPGQVVEYASEGTIDGLVKPVPGSEKTFQYYMRHSPAAGEPTQRIETYLLPAGAELISTTPEDMERRTKDGRIELRVEKMIPIGDSITTSFRYRLGAGEGSLPNEQNATQSKGEQIIKKMAEVNRYWLIESPSQTKNYSYEFALYHGETKTFKVSEPSSADRTIRQGITYDSLLHKLAKEPFAATYTSIEEVNGIIRTDFKLKESIQIHVGNGLRERWYGSFDQRVEEGTFWIDAKKMFPVRTKCKEVYEYFSDYAAVDETHYVPLRVKIDENDMPMPMHLHFDWTFKLHKPGLWLFDESHYLLDGNKPVVAASISNVRVNGELSEQSPVGAKDANKP